MTQRSETGQNVSPITAQDVFEVCGEIDDAKVVAIVEAQPSYEELEEAAAWIAEEGDVPREDRHPLSGKAAVVYEILATELEPDTERE